jgi:two-component system sensor histidine kinase KdpD
MRALMMDPGVTSEGRARSRPEERPEAAEAEVSPARALLLLACHDLSAPLTAVHLHAQSVLARLRNGEDISGEALRKTLERVEQLALDGIRLVDDVLSADALAGTSRGPGAPEVDAEQVLASAISVQSETLLRAGCTIFVTRDESLHRAAGPWDRRSLESLFSNLLQNAGRHAAGAPIAVRFSRQGDRLCIRFSDGGPGLPPGVSLSGGLPAPSARRNRGGHGLGIWLVRQAVARLRGDLAVIETPGPGLTVEIQLPF